MAASSMSSTFMEQYQQICLCCCCSWTLGEGPQETSKYFPCWTVQLWKRLSFNCFSNPAQGKYAWTGLDEEEVANINDFRWSKELIAWKELLNLLEDAPCKLSRPKNVFATDLHIIRSNIFPVFATGIRPIEYVGAYGLRDERETVMMDSRWRIFEFSHQIPKNDIQDIPACSKYFHDIVMLGSAN